MGGEGDPYLLAHLIELREPGTLDRYLAAMQAVIDRHDILRQRCCGKDLTEPVQVVWRKAPLQVEEVELDSETGDVAGQLYALL